MPHLRSRYAEDLLKRALKHSPIVGVFGQRQVGKTTLISGIGANYRNLDKESVRLELEEDPALFIHRQKIPFAIDEAQLSPRLFPALKEHVRANHRQGQFILSGSVRFTSRKAIRESLTGRISVVEILPFTCSEAEGKPLPSLLAKLTRVKKQRDLESVFQNTGPHSESTFKTLLVNGGLPGICFFRAPEVRADRWGTQLDTLLNRDLRLVHETTLPYQALRDLLEHLANRQGKPFELNEAVKATQISAITLKKILFAFEALFLIRRVRCAGDRKRDTFFLEDQGMASWIARRT